eukprot:1077354-Pelagomonas_calceolata.AAC.1
MQEEICMLRSCRIQHHECVPCTVSSQLNSSPLCWVAAKSMYNFVTCLQLSIQMKAKICKKVLLEVSQPLKVLGILLIYPATLWHSPVQEDYDTGTDLQSVIRAIYTSVPTYDVNTVAGKLSAFLADDPSEFVCESGQNTLGILTRSMHTCFRASAGIHSLLRPGCLLNLLEFGCPACLTHGLTSVPFAGSPPKGIREMCILDSNNIAFVDSSNVSK